MSLEDNVYIENDIGWSHYLGAFENISFITTELDKSLLSTVL